jgi:hypothetical protein
MGGAAHSERVDKTIDVEALIREIQRYLAVVNAFRAGARKPGKARRKENG